MFYSEEVTCNVKPEPKNFKINKKKEKQSFLKAKKKRKKQYKQFKNVVK